MIHKQWLAIVISLFMLTGCDNKVTMSMLKGKWICSEGVSFRGGVDATRNVLTYSHVNDIPQSFSIIFSPHDSQYMNIQVDDAYPVSVPFKDQKTVHESISDYNSIQSSTEYEYIDGDNIMMIDKFEVLEYDSDKVLQPNSYGDKQQYKCKRDHSLMSYEIRRG